jgi:hypothetical protein
VQGDIQALRICRITCSARDGLWQHTCAELFIAVPHQEAYFEFNFAPSNEWAAYEFSAYRHQGVRMTEFDSPTIVCRQREDELLLQVDLAVPSLAHSERWQLGLSMVIEDAQAICLTGRCCMRASDLTFTGATVLCWISDRSSD